MSKRPNGRVAGAAVALLLIIAALIFGAVRYRHRLRLAYDWGRTLLASRATQANSTLTNILFIHHSTGQALIAQGNVRSLLAAEGYEFWDHDYNSIGLTRPDGTLAGYSYYIPQDNTDPDGYARLFAQREHKWPINSLSAVMQHRVILFKSCFPTSDIANQEQLEQYKGYYLGIREVIDRHPDHLFIALTPPPLVPEATTPENAARAREWANWLKSDEFLAGHANLYVFDFFGLLAEDSPDSPDRNMLRAAYRNGSAGDSHPNELANTTIGPLLTSFVRQIVESHR